MKKSIMVLVYALAISLVVSGLVMAEARQSLVFGIDFLWEHECTKGYGHPFPDAKIPAYPGDDYECTIFGGNSTEENECSQEVQKKGVMEQRIPAGETVLKQNGWPVDKLANGGFLPGVAGVKVECFKKIGASSITNIAALNEKLPEIVKDLPVGSEPTSEWVGEGDDKKVRLHLPQDPPPLPPLPLLFTLGAEAIYAPWGVKEDALKDNSEIDDHQEVGVMTMALSPFVGIGWEFNDSWAFMLRGRYAYVFEAPETRHNCWGGDGVLMWRPIGDMEVEAGPLYYWLNVVNRIYDNHSADDENRAERAEALVGGIFGLNWRLGTNDVWRGWKLRLPSITFGKQMGTSIYRWSGGAGLEYRF